MTYDLSLIIVAVRVTRIVELVCVVLQLVLLQRQHVAVRPAAQEPPRRVEVRGTEPLPASCPDTPAVTRLPPVRQGHQLLPWIKL